MPFLFLKAYASLIEFDLYLARRDFPALYDKVRTFPLATSVAGPNVVRTICSAVNRACIYYRKEVLCLQRSAATTCLLRKHGVAADLVLGARQVPFKAHAWIEVKGQVVNDKPYIRDIYAELDRL
jgi:prolyl oligopeptidase